MIAYAMRSSFLRDAFDPGPTVSTRALTSRTEGFPCMMRTTLIAKRSKKNKPMKGENAGDRMMSGQHKKSD